MTRGVLSEMRNYDEEYIKNGLAQWAHASGLG